MCQYCLERRGIDHICPVRIAELSRDGVSPGKPVLTPQQIRAIEARAEHAARLDPATREDSCND